MFDNADDTRGLGNIGIGGIDSNSVSGPVIFFVTRFKLLASALSLVLVL
jgi:hypothetical protein